MKILRKFYTSLLISAFLAGGAGALPEGASITNGTVNITTNGNTQTITQGSNQAIINWNGFNIDVGELVHFVQPSSISAILNRVVGQDPSVILGSLRANGQVFLINPNGVVFGQTANVDVGSLVVSTLNITDDDFLQGNLTFQQEADKDLASVINHGRISIDDNGFLVLTGPMVANEGVILAKAGQVALAAGTRSTVSFDPTGMIQVALPQGSQTDTGIVSLSQSATSDILASVVGTGAAPAGQLVVRDGQTFLEVASGTVVNTGEIRADANSGETAGRVVLDSTSHTLLADGSVLSAAGSGVESHGGEVYVLSDGQSTSALGSLIDVSGGESGDAGFAEQSGGWGSVNASVDLSAPGGEAGTFLIDPLRILVEAGAGTGPGDATLMMVSEDFIEGTSAGTVLLQADNGVEFEALTREGVDRAELELSTDVNLVIDLIGAGDGQPAVSFQNPGDVIALNGTGAFTLTSVTGTDVQDLRVDAVDGNIDLDLNGGNITGESSFASSTGQTTITNTANVGTALNPIEVSGNFSPNVTGDVFIDGVGDVTLVSSQSNSLTATGGNFTISNPGRGNATQANSFFDFNLTGDISGGELEAPTVTIVADTIGLNSIVELDFDDLFLTADYIMVDNQVGTHNGNNVVITNTALSDMPNQGMVFFDFGGEGTFFAATNPNGLGPPGMITTEADSLSLTYNTAGDFFFNSIETLSDLTINTDGSISGGSGINSVGALNITASDINLSVEGADRIDSFDGTATTGDVSFNYSGLTNAPTIVQGNAANGDVFLLASSDFLNVGPTVGNMVTLIGDGVTATDVSAASIVSSSRGGDINIDSTLTTPVTFSANGFLGGNPNINFTANGDINTNEIDGNTISLNSGMGAINTSQDRIIGDTSVTLVALSGVDVLTTTDAIDVNSNGNVVVDNLLNSSSALDVIVDTSGDADITTDGELDAQGGLRGITANNVVLVADRIAAEITAQSVDFTANDGAAQIELDGDTTVTGSSTDTMFGGDINIFATGDVVIAAGGLTSTGGTSDIVSLNVRGPADSSISGPGTISADDVGLMANGSIQANIDGAEFIYAVSENEGIALANQNSPTANILLASLGTGNVSFISDNDINVAKVFAQDGNISLTSTTSAIIATTDPSTVMIGEGQSVPGNTVAALNGSVTLQAVTATEGLAIDANVTTGGSGTGDLIVDAVGDIRVTGTEGGVIDVDIESTMGTVEFNETGTVTGTLSGNDLTEIDVSITANIIDVSLGNNVNSVDTTSLGGDTTVVANNASLQISNDSTMGGSIYFQNNGGAITNTAAGLNGENITLTATGDLTLVGIVDAGTGLVDLQGTNVTAMVQAGELIADATSGNVDVEVQPSAAVTVGGTATGEYRVVNDGAISTNQVSAGSIFLDAQGTGNGISNNSGTLAAGDIELRSDSTLQATIEGVTALTIDAQDDVNLNNLGTAAVTFTADAGSGDLTLTSVGSVNTAGVSGDNIDLSATGAGSAITTTQGRIIGDSSVTLDAPGGVNVLTTTDDLDITAGGTVIVDNAQNGEGAELQLVVDAPGQSVTVVSEADIEGPSFSGALITADTADLTAPDIFAELTVNTFLFNATDGDVFADLRGPTTVSGTASNSGSSTDVILVGNDNIIIGAAGIDAGTNNSAVFLENAFRGTVSGTGVVSADAVDITSDGVQINLDGVSDLDILIDNNITTGGIDVANQNVALVDILLVNFGTGDVSYSGGDTINVEKIFARQGNISLQSPGSAIIATTDPSTIVVGEGLTPAGNTISAPSGSVTLEGSSITANVTTAGSGTQDLVVDATGDVVINGTEGGTLDVDVQSTMGTVSFTETGTVTGIFSGNSDVVTDVSITANTIDVTLGSDVDTLSTTSTGGDVTAVGNNNSLDVTSSNPQGGSVDLQNNGGSLNLNVNPQQQGPVADNVTLTASGDVTASGTIDVGSGTVDLEGANVTATIMAAELIADATDGNVNVDVLPFGNIIAGGTATGEYRVRNASGAISTNQITAGSILLQTGSLVPDLPTPQNDISTNSGFLDASDIELRSVGPVQAETRGVTNLIVTSVGDVTVNNSGSTITGGLVTARGFAGRQGPSDPVDVTLTNTGGIVNNSSPTSGFSVTASGNATVTSTGGGNVDVLAEVDGDLNLSGGTVSVQNVSSENVTTTSTVGDTIIESIPTAPVNFDVTSARDINIESSGDAVILNADANRDVVIDTNGSGAVIQSGTIAGDSVTVSATTVDISVDANSATANASAGNATVRGTSSANLLTVAGSATGEFFATSPGGLTHGNINAPIVTLDGGRNGGNVGRSGNSVITAPTQVTLTGANINAGTNSPIIDAQAPGNVTIENQGNTVNDVVVVAGQDASFTTPGTATISQFEGQNLTLDVGQSITGDFNGGTVNLSGTEIDVTVQANEVSATARTGDASVVSSGSNTLTVTDSSAAGNFDLSHGGDIEFDRIEAQNVTITTPGDITDTANTIVASGITLNGNNVFVNTQGQIIVINAQGNVTVGNTTVDVSSLSIDAQGNVSFDTDGNLNIAQVAGGQLVELTVGGNISADPNAFVRATDVSLEVGGAITPDLDNPLDIQASNTITVTAPGATFLGQGGGLADIAAALTGSIPDSSVIIGSGSGPIYYNGVLLNPGAPTAPPVIPPIIAPPNVIDQIGQQNGQVIDDGSVGSAANDGLVEQSPTQKLVAQLTENTEGGGEGQTTAALLTLDIDDMGDVQVKLEQPSAYDESINKSDDMTADDILDLETGELVEVKVAVYYDSTNDQLVMAVDLRADDIIDLNVEEYGLIPLNLEYSFLADPNLLLEKLRADDLIDLEVEDLGKIPIRVHVEGDNQSATR